MIYKDELDYFLKGLDVSLDTIVDIYKEKEKFLSPSDLLNEILKKKSISVSARSLVKKVNQIYGSPDPRLNMYPRTGAMLGLADIYAKTVDRDTYLIDVDIYNCSCVGKILGKQRILKALKIINSVISSELKSYGADSVFAFDSAKNDDFKVIASGISEEDLSKALQIAHSRIDDVFKFAYKIPHSKRPGQYGLGVGIGFCDLAGNQETEAIELDLERKIEKSKARYKSNGAINSDDNKEYSSSDVCREFDRLYSSFFPEDDINTLSTFFLETAKAEAKHIFFDPFYNFKSIEGLSTLSKIDQKIAQQFIGFHLREDELTGAINERLLITDIKDICAEHNDASLMSIKLENCAGVNRILSRAHSIEMTRDFVNTVQAFCNSDKLGVFSKGVYYTGQNSFILLFRKKVTDKDFSEFRTRLSEYFEGEINERTIKDYFNNLGLKIQNNSISMEDRMGDISNSRGNNDGIRITNFLSVNIDQNFNLSDLYEFQDRALRVADDLQKSDKALKSKHGFR